MTRERPILFSAPMVRAIIDGSKTQTRRVVKWPVMSRSDGNKRRVFVERDVDKVNALLREPGRSPLQKIASPHGRAGWQLWVRETWGVCHENADQTAWRQQLDDARERLPRAPLVYRATDGAVHEGPWKPSIHMPRWASRITLDMAGVRVERLQDISQQDAKAEGINAVYRDTYGDERDAEYIEGPGGFRWLWDSINGKRTGCSWDDNPWVWVVEFNLEGDDG